MIMCKVIIHIVVLVIIPVLVYGALKNGKCISGDCNNGRGKFMYNDGNEYTGSWQNGKRHGYGMMVWVQTCLRKYRFDKQQGPYRYDGKSYPIDPIVLPILTVITNVKESKTRKFFDQLDLDIKYIGNWSNDAMDGTGTLYLNDGTIMYGKWVQDKYMGK